MAARARGSQSMAPPITRIRKGDRPREYPIESIFAETGRYGLHSFLFSVGGKRNPMPSALARRTILPVALLLTGLLGATPAHAQLSQNIQDWMRRINSGKFSAGGGRGAGRGGRGGGAGRWMDGGKVIDFSNPLAAKLERERIDKWVTGQEKSTGRAEMDFADWWDKWPGQF